MPAPQTVKVYLIDKISGKEIQESDMLPETFMSLIKNMSTKMLGKPFVKKWKDEKYSYYDYGSQKHLYKVRGL